MDKFKNELAATKNPWIKRIGEYLLSRDDIKENLKKENKSLEECFRYILQELAQKCKKEGKVGYAAGDDEELYSLAVHYYDEDDITVEKKNNFKTNANGTATIKELQEKTNTVNKNSSGQVAEKEKLNQDAIDQAVKSALDSYKKEEKEKQKKKREEQKQKREAKKEKKKQLDASQMDIFSFLGDENV